MNETISIIVPVYNAEATLPRCVDAILSQTYTNIELILVDDGSVDSSPALCDMYCENDKRVRTIHLRNGGPALARNAGIEAASGTYVAFADSDDFMLSNALEQLLDCMIKNGAELVQACTAKVYADGSVIPESNEKSVLVLNRGEAMADYIKNPKPIVRFAVWGKLFRRDVIGDCRFESRKNHEDVEFMTKIIDRCETIVYLPELIYHTYVYENSLSRRKIDKKKIDDAFAVSDTIIALLESKSEYSELIPFSYRARVLSIMSTIREVIECKPEGKKALLVFLKSELKRFGLLYRFHDLPHQVLYYTCRISPHLHKWLYKIASVLS